MTNCPVCGSVNLTNEHLMREYRGLMGCCSGFFGPNARRAINEIAAELLSRGVTHLYPGDWFFEISIRADW